MLEERGHPVLNVKIWSDQTDRFVKLIKKINFSVFVLDKINLWGYNVGENWISGK